MQESAPIPAIKSKWMNKYTEYYVKSKMGNVCLVYTVSLPHFYAIVFYFQNL
jgi:hypothetical protein